MGMDVYGKNPTAVAGEYFRNNVWYWHPLWTLCCEVDPEGAGSLEGGHFNDGDGLDEIRAIRLADLLTQWIKDGRLDRYIKERQDWLDSLPLLECKYCDGTGTRHDAIEIWERRQLGDPFGIGHLIENDPRPESPDFECNACHGHGKVVDWQTHYILTKENVVEFRDFLLSCGGFEIC